MPIEATEPTAISATYDLWAISGFRMVGDGCASIGEAAPSPIVVVVRMVKYRLRTDGTPERSPHPGDVRQFEIADLYAEAAINPEFAAAMASLTSAVAGHAAAQGAL